MKLFKSKIDQIFCFLLGLMLLFGSCQSNESSSETLQEFSHLETQIAQIQNDLDNGKYTIEQLVKSYIHRIEEVDQTGIQLNSVIMVNPDAIQIAQSLDKELQDGKKRGPMHGIPVLLKDNIDTKDKMPTTVGSRALANSYPLQDSHVAQKLRASGAVILGKANLSEWANFRGELSSSGWSGVHGQTKNPYILDRNPCGSSSGSGVAVSANLCMIAIGTETNGSIVCPSSNNGIVGIKPTVGLISRSGIVPISHTQDTPGPMARTVTDAAICLGALVGVDSLDSKTLHKSAKFETDYTKFLNKKGLQGKKIGVYKKAFGINYKVDNLMMQAISLMEEQGAEMVDIDQISEPHVGGQSFQVMLYEYKDGLNKYFASLGKNASIKSLEELIEYNKNDSIELAFYNQKYLEMAQEKAPFESEEFQELLSNMLNGSRDQGMDRVMNTYDLDAIIAPTGGPAWKTDHVNGDHYTLGSSSPAAHAGYPNISVPMGFVGELPVGISFFGRAWSEPVLIEMAFAYEQLTHHRKPPKFLATD